MKRVCKIMQKMLSVSDRTAASIAGAAAFAWSAYVIMATPFSLETILLIALDALLAEELLNWED